MCYNDVPRTSFYLFAIRSVSPSMSVGAADSKYSENGKFHTFLRLLRCMEVVDGTFDQKSKCISAEGSLRPIRLCIIAPSKWSVWRQGASMCCAVPFWDLTDGPWVRSQFLHRLINLWGINVCKRNSLRHHPVDHPQLIGVKISNVKKLKATSRSRWRENINCVPP